MKIKKQCVLKIVWNDGGWKWYRVKPGRNFQSIVNWFTKVPAFKYGKLYVYDRNTRTVHEQIGHFGKSESGSIYQDYYDY